MDAYGQATVPGRDVGRTTWAIDPVQSLVGFAVRHIMGSTFKGYFTDFAGVLTLDEADVRRSSVAVTIDAASVDTHNAQRDAHLRSGDFLDVALHPTIVFESWGIELRADDQAKVSGDLTIRGVTRLVVLDVERNGRAVTPDGEDVMGFSATTTISRKDYGLTWNVALDAGGVLVADEVVVQLEIEAIKQT
jgi:polyisoprenoid-binding protein YceI